MKTYSNPETSKTINDWPYGQYRTTAMFYVETDPKRGQRACRRTVDPKTGRLGKPACLTYHKTVRIVDGDDGKTYILQDAAPYGHLSVMQGNMKYQEESIPDTDPRFPQYMALLAQEEVAA